MIVACLLFAIGAALTAITTFTMVRSGPEGPVGAHMVTAPLAFLQVLGLGIGTACGLVDGTGLPGWAVWLSLPGYVVALTMLPILPWERRYRTPARAAVTAVALGGAAMFVGNTIDGVRTPLVLLGAAPVLLAGLGGDAVLLSLWVQIERNAAKRRAADAERMATFEREQAEFQRTEWQKLGPDAGLWQLIQFCHSFDPDVQRECRARIAAMPNLGGAMQELLGTGWAEHALPCLRDAYPASTAALAPALTDFYGNAAERWETSLAGTNPGSWYANLATYVDVAERVAADGGDMRAAMRRWRQLLQGKRGLEGLANRVAALAG